MRIYNIFFKSVPRMFYIKKEVELLQYIWSTKKLARSNTEAHTPRLETPRKLCVEHRTIHHGGRQQAPPHGASKVASSADSRQVKRPLTMEAAGTNAKGGLWLCRKGRRPLARALPKLSYNDLNPARLTHEIQWSHR
jgi:hypothetical protein